MTTPIISTDAQSRLLSDTVCLEVRFSKLGIKRSAGTSQIEVNADKEMLSLTKDIIDSKEIQAIVTADTFMKKKLKAYAVPTKMFRHGIFPIRTTVLSIVDDLMQEFIAARTAMVDAFLQRGSATNDDPDGTPSPYEQRISEAKERLRELFDPANYPAAETVRRKFNVSFQYTNWGVPKSLSDISPEIYQRESAKIRNRLAEAETEIRMALRIGTKQLIDHLKERLAPSEDGKKKKFHYTAISNLKEWIDTFDPRDVTSDKDLASIIEQAREIISGADPQSIRENEALRDYVTKGITAASEKLDQLVIVSTGNDRMFGEDEEEAA